MYTMKKDVVRVMTYLPPFENGFDVYFWLPSLPGFSVLLKDS